MSSGIGVVSARGTNERRKQNLIVLRARVCPVAKRHKAKPSLQVTAPEVAAAGALRRAPITGLRHQPHQELLAKPRDGPVGLQYG